MSFTFGSCFAGIGGLDLGLERAGMTCKWQIENDPFCQRVLSKHWPNVTRYGDIRTVEQPEYVDLICGGFPCQDVSNAGTKRGLDGERSGLWRELHRLTDLVRPRTLLVENVSALLVRGMGRVLGELAEIGYDAEWDCLPAYAFGAEHKRERVFIIAYPMQPGLQVRSKAGKINQDAKVFGKGLGFAIGTPHEGLERCGASRWSGDVHGIPGRMDRIRTLGNSVVPQVAEYLGRRVLESFRGEVWN